MQFELEHLVPEAAGATVIRFILVLAFLRVSYGIYSLVRFKTRQSTLQGPRASSFIFGVSKLLSDSRTNSLSLYEKWVEQYGSVFQIPAPFGSRKVVICDPKAVAHFYSLESTVYRREPTNQRALGRFLGEGLLYAENDDHKRQRRVMTPAFNNAAIRRYTPVFFDSAYKVKAAWDALFETASSEETIVEVQYWMNRISLDSIGIAGFSHDFESLHGKRPPVIDVFESFDKLGGSGMILFILAPFLPLLGYIPNKRKQLVKTFKGTIRDISDVLLRRTKEEKEAGGVKHDADKSIIGTLIQSENAEGRLSLTGKEIRDQTMVLLFAGYETTSISLTWSLIELAKYPEKQNRLRDELSQYYGKDPTYEQLLNSFPYLDAVMHEVLRLHPPVTESTRMAFEDDILPLATPIKMGNGKMTDNVHIVKGDIVVSSVTFMNTAYSIWGDDAKEFIPERWIDEKGITENAKKNPGYHHLMTFVDGQRMCLGKNFAIAEYKAVLSVLIRNFSFSLRDGPDSKFETVRAILPRPKLVGEDGVVAPLRVRRVEVN